MYKSNTLLILYVYVSILDTIKIILFITSEHFTRDYYTNETHLKKTIIGIVLREHYELLHTRNIISRSLLSHTRTNKHFRT